VSILRVDINRVDREESRREPRGRQSCGRAKRTEPDVLKRMLPLAATLMMGAFSKQSGHESSATAALGRPGGGIGAMLTPFLDQMAHRLAPET
jgi:hypothetical protein